MPIRSLLAAAALVAAAAVVQPVLAKKSEWRVPSIAARTKNPIAPDGASLKQGKQLWAAQCASCHGAEGRGDGPESRKLDKKTPDFADAELLSSQSDGELFRKISIGRRPMPGYGKTLTDAQRWHLVNHMRTLVRRK